MLIAAYGTLRNGLMSAKYLTDRYGSDAVQNPKPPITISGYKLYVEWLPAHNIWCPFAVHTPSATMVVDILDIKDGQPANDIYQAKPRDMSRLVTVPSGDYLDVAGKGKDEL